MSAAEFLEPCSCRHRSERAKATARVGRLDLVSLLRTGPSDHQKPYRLTIDFVDADGNRLHVLEDTIVFDDPAEGVDAGPHP